MAKAKKNDRLLKKWLAAMRKMQCRLNFKKWQEIHRRYYYRWHKLNGVTPKKFSMISIGPEDSIEKWFRVKGMFSVYVNSNVKRG